MDSSIKKNLSTVDILSTENKDYIDIFLNHLKTQYDYDNVSLFTFKTPFENYNFSVLNDALNSILSVKLRNETRIMTKEDIELHKVFVLNYFDTISIVKLSRSYDLNEENLYLIISVHLNEANEFIISLPERFNNFKIINHHNVVNDQMKSYYFDDHMSYLNFKIDIVSKSCILEESLIVKIKVANETPLLSYSYDSRESIQTNYNRKAQLNISLIKINDIELLIDLKLKLNKITLKQYSAHMNIDEFNIKKVVERFIFPVNEGIELLNSWNINPQLTYDFMNVDYSNFWDIKMMVQI